MNEEVCTARLCVASCPKKILQLHGVDERVIVASALRIPETGENLRANACIGCELCQSCPEAVEVKNYLAQEGSRV